MGWLLNSDCFIIKGYLKSSIYDLTREKVIFIPNDLADLLIKGSEDFTTLNSLQYDYFNLLITNEIIYELPDENIKHFPKIHTTFYNIFSIHTITIMSSTINYSYIEKVYNEYLQHHNTKVIVLIFNYLILKNDIEKILKLLYSSTVEKLIIITNKRYFIPHFDGFEVTQIMSDNPTEEFIFNQKAPPTKKNITINRELFLESVNYNTFFNGKLFLDDNVNPFYDYTFLYTAHKNKLDREKFINKLGLIKKDDIFICNNCELRHMCSDSRIPHHRKDDSWYHKTECNYNPYICKWKDEEGYKTLAECGVISNENGFSIDHDKIAAINKELWEEEETENA